MKFKIEFWVLRYGCYDKDIIDVEAETRLQALKRAMDKNKRGKDFKIIG